MFMSWSRTAKRHSRALARATYSIAPCARFGPASGTGKRDTRSGTSGSGGGRWSRRTRSTTVRACCCSIRSRCRQIEKLADERETAIVLTCPWHRRDAEALANRYDAPLYVPPPDEGDPSPVGGTVFREGDWLPVGVEAFPGMEPNDLMLWVASHAALVAGDTLQDRGDGLQFLGDLANNVPVERGVAAEQLLEGMQQLLALPVEIVLLTHGAPVDKAALERVLATADR